MISRKVEPASNLLGMTGSIKRKKHEGNLHDFKEIGIDAVSIGKFRKKVLAQMSDQKSFEVSGGEKSLDSI